MIFLLIAAAVGFAAGIWLVATTLFPATPSLADALERLHDNRPTRAITPSTAPSDSFLVRLGQRLLDRTSLDVLTGEQTIADLELVRRPLEVHAGATAAGAIGGAMIGPLMWGVLTVAGAPLPVLISAAFMPIGAVAGFLLPRALLQSEAATARADFRHALGAYLDVLVLLLAGGEGFEGAMRKAAQAGNGPAFMELRRATTQAAYSGAIWDALDDLGQRVGIIEIREISTAGTLAGEGAAVRRSLVAKARSLRNSTLNAAEVAARKRSQAMFAPIVLIGFAFITFLIYPLLTNISI
jgi:tight adherence protein C